MELWYSVPGFKNLSHEVLHEKHLEPRKHLERTFLLTKGAFSFRTDIKWDCQISNRSKKVSRTLDIKVVRSLQKLAASKFLRLQYLFDDIRPYRPRIRQLTFLVIKIGKCPLKPIGRPDQFKNKLFAWSIAVPEFGPVIDYTSCFSWYWDVMLWSWTYKLFSLESQH